LDVEKNKTIARHFVQIWGKGDLSLIDELASPEITMYYPAFPRVVNGITGLKKFFTVGIPSIFGDRDVQVDEVIAEGEKVVLRWSFSLTHKGEWPQGTPATGKRLKWTGITIYRIVNGRVVDEKGEEDYFGAFRQLGIIPNPPAQ